MKQLVVLGGPNGAGKTTAAQDLLPKALGIREFVNADEIARGLSPFNPEATALAAGRLMVERIHALAAAGESFAFETTCAGRGHVRLLEKCRDHGYRIYLPAADVAFIYDNSDRGRTAIAERLPGASLAIRDSQRWKMIEEATR